MADNDFFPIPSTLPGEDPGNKVRFLKRTVSGTEEGVQAIVIVDKDDPTVGLSVGADGIEVDNKTLAPGAATSAAQATGNASLASIDGKAPALVGGRVPVDGSGVTQPVSGPLTDAELRASAVPVSAASLPLPSGAATSAAQTTGNASLSSIDGKTPALGQALAAASVPVVLPAAQVSALTPPAAITGFALESGGNLATLVSEIGATNETAPGSDTATAGLSGRLQRIAQRLTSLLALFPSTLGQTTKAASLSVAVASDQSTMPVGSKPVTASASFTRPADTTAYAVGDVVCNSTSSPVVMTFAGMALANGAGGMLTRVRLILDTNPSTKPTYMLFLFNVSPTIDNDNAAFTPTTAELGNCIATIPLGLPVVGDVSSTSTNTVYWWTGAWKYLTNGATSLYGVLVAQSAITPASADVYAVELMADLDPA